MRVIFILYFMNQLISCPYNAFHKVTEKRLMFHVVRCSEKEKVGHLFDHCPYNFLHILKKEVVIINMHRKLKPIKSSVLIG